MPQVRKIPLEEVELLQAKAKGQRKLMEELYDSLLGEYVAGDYCEALLEADESRLNVRNRLRAAATRRDLAIEFRRTSGDLVRFKIVEHSAQNAKTVVAAPALMVAAAPKNKGGRPRKSV